LWRWQCDLLTSAPLYIPRSGSLRSAWQRQADASADLGSALAYAQRSPFVLAYHKWWSDIVDYTSFISARFLLVHFAAGVVLRYLRLWTLAAGACRDLVNGLIDRVDLSLAPRSHRAPYRFTFIRRLSVADIIWRLNDCACGSCLCCRTASITKSWAGGLSSHRSAGGFYGPGYRRSPASPMAYPSSFIACPYQSWPAPVAGGAMAAAGRRQHQSHWPSAGSVIPARPPSAGGSPLIEMAASKAVGLWCACACGRAGVGVFSLCL